MSAPSQVIRVTLRKAVTEGDSSDPADSIVQKIQAIRQSVAELREENLELQRVRDQFIIHLQQCQEDHNLLRRICRKLKLQLDLATQQASATSGSPTASVQPAPVEPKPAAIPARRMATLEIIHPTPLIEAAEPCYENLVRLRFALNTSSLVCSARFSPDGTRLAFADGDFVYIVASGNADVISTIELAAQQHTRALRWSPDGQWIALSGPSNSVLLYHAEKGELIHAYHGHEGEVTAVVFNADGSWLVSAGLDGLIFVWDTKDHRQVMRLPHGQDGSDGAIIAMDTAPEVPFYAVGFASGAVGVYSEKFDQPMICFTAHENKLMGMAVSPVDGTIATGCEDCCVKVWLLDGIARCKHVLRGHTSMVLSLCFARDSDLLFTGGKDQKIRLWRYKEGKPVCTISVHNNSLFSIDHHPSQRSFVSCSGDGVVCVWDYNELGQ